MSELETKSGNPSRSNILNLETRRQQKNKLILKQRLTQEQRIRDLEEDVLRLIDMVHILDNETHKQEETILGLLRLLAASASSDVSSESFRELVGPKK